MEDLLDKLKKFRSDRNWQKYHTRSELARAIMIEGAELNRLFLWGEEWHSTNGNLEKNIKEELADVMIYCLNMCLVCGLNPVEICNSKIDLNEIKYQVVKL